MRLLKLALGTAILVATVACNRIRVEDVKGPDGGEWVRISCRHMDRRCYQTASRMCPSGFYFADSAGVAPTHAREVDAEDDGAEAAAVTAAPTPQAGVNTKTLPPQESWSGDMYSRKSGAILVRCATGERTASN